MLCINLDCFKSLSIDRPVASSSSSSATLSSSTLSTSNRRSTKCFLDLGWDSRKSANANANDKESAKQCIANRAPKSFHSSWKSKAARARTSPRPAPPSFSPHILRRHLTFAAKARRPRTRFERHSSTTSTSARTGALTMQLSGWSACFAGRTSYLSISVTISGCSAHVGAGGKVAKESISCFPRHSFSVHPFEGSITGIGVRGGGREGSQTTKAARLIHILISFLTMLTPRFRSIRFSRQLPMPRASSDNTPVIVCCTTSSHNDTVPPIPQYPRPPPMIPLPPRRFAPAPLCRHRSRLRPHNHPSPPVYPPYPEYWLAAARHARSDSIGAQREAEETPYCDHVLGGAGGYDVEVQGNAVLSLGWWSVEDGYRGVTEKAAVMGRTEGDRGKTGTGDVGATRTGAD
ncbi:hypothetical protein R3P38DRAFT_3182733 [Favolaschia claudopus]|uniref:Uncharacterized protein n=1 Tax=Favolaschia claudopus TaxID=2862362 RepID=A0AAW0CFV7_9AGAR